MLAEFWADLWAFLSDPDNQKTIGIIVGGGGLGGVVLSIVGLWVRRSRAASRIDIRGSPSLGGEGGRAPGSGGGGGGAIGSGASGGRGGRGGRLSFHGRAGQAPGAGGGGAGAEGEGAIGGEGGEGGELAVGVFLAEGLPSAVPIKVGRGGRGGEGADGEHGEDSYFGDLMTAKGGRGGRAGRMQSPARQVVSADLEKGLGVAGIYLADCVHIRNGLLDLLSGSWEHFEVSRLPFDAQWPLACTVSMGEVEPGEILELTAEVTDPAGTLVLHERFTVTRGDHRTVARPNVALNLRFSISCIGVWLIKIVSGSVELAQLPIEVRLRPEGA
jgi:hypothetical protein